MSQHNTPSHGTDACGDITATFPAPDATSSDERRSDIQISEEVERRFSESPLLDAGDLQVFVQDDIVTLRGTVANEVQKRHAQDLATACAGVVEVRDELHVTDADAASAASSVPEQHPRDGAPESPAAITPTSDR